MNFDVISPHSLNEALDALSADNRLVPLAGATDLMVYLEAGSLPACNFLNLQQLEELKPIRFADGCVQLGALTTYRDVRTSSVGRDFPLLALAAREVGALAIQNRGTWAGNIANASPAADGVPALMAYDAEVELSSKSGRRLVPLSGFYVGYKQTLRQPNELITAIRLPASSVGAVGEAQARQPAASSDDRPYFRKVGARRFQAISKTLLAGRIFFNSDRTVKDIRMVFASVAPYTLRAIQTESLLRGRYLTRELIDEAAKAIQDEIHPIDDIRSTEIYRRRVTSNLLREFLSQKMLE